MELVNGGLMCILFSEAFIARKNLLGRILEGIKYAR
jgi:hypothetical protein